MTHLLKICFNNRGRFMKVLKFVTNQKTKSMIILEGDMMSPSLMRRFCWRFLVGVSNPS